MKLQRVTRFTLFLAAPALLLAGAWLSSPLTVAGRIAGQSTLQGAAALERLKQDGQYESLQDAMNQARFSVSLSEKTPLGRSAWHAPNRAAGNVHINYRNSFMRGVATIAPAAIINYNHH